MPIDRELFLHRATTLLGVAALVLVVVNSILLVGNRGRQGEVNSRQAFINQSARLARLNQELVNALAQAAVRRKDDALRSLLNANGITINVGAPESSAAPAPVPAAKPATTSKPK